MKINSIKGHDDLKINSSLMPRDEFNFKVILKLKSKSKLIRNPSGKGKPYI